MTRRWLVLLLAVTLTGCGFQLRGSQPLPPMMSTTYLAGTNNTPLDYELESAILAAGSQLVKNRDEASAVLTLHSQRFDRRERGVDARGRANVYEHRLQVIFSLHDHEGKALTEREAISLTREQRFNPDQALAMDDEREMIREEMRRQVVQQLMRRVQALARQ